MRPRHRHLNSLLTNVARIMRAINERNSESALNASVFLHKRHRLKLFRTDTRSVNNSAPAVQFYVKRKKKARKERRKLCKPHQSYELSRVNSVLSLIQLAIASSRLNDVSRNLQIFKLFPYNF